MAFPPILITLVYHATGSDTDSWLLTLGSLWIGWPHSVVVYPDSTEDVVKIVNVARKYRMPIVPYSGGTSLEGHFAGVSTHLPHTLPYGHFLNIVCSASAVEKWGHMRRHVWYG
jgi:hypothetical protein